MFDWFWEFLYSIMKAVFFCIDFMIDIAGMLCGIEPIMVNGEKQDLLYYFITDDIIVGAFEAVLVIGFILLFIFTAYSVFRSMGRLGEGKSAIQTCMDSAKTLLYFFLVPCMMTLGVIVVSTVMTSVYNATSMGDCSVGGVLFAAAADGAWDGDGDKTEILNYFIQGVDGYDYYSLSDVKKYFDLESMDYLIGCLSGIVVLVLIALSLFGFVERIVGIIFLFIVSPLSMSTAPLDDGARFKLWRDQVINKYLIAYGALLSINIFMLLVNTVQQVNFFENSFLNLLARVAFIIGGAFACHKGSVMAGNLINQGAGTADKMENAAINAGLRNAAGNVVGFVAGHTVGKLAHIAGMPFRHMKKDISSAFHRQSNANRSAKDMQMQQKYTEKLRAAEPRQKNANLKTGGTAGVQGGAGAQGAAGAAGCGGSHNTTSMQNNQSQSNLESILKKSGTHDNNHQHTADTQRQTEKPSAPASDEGKKKTSTADALKGSVAALGAVDTAKEQSSHQAAQPINQHMQGKVSSAIQNRAIGKDGENK